ncbi:hypothetical protein PROFUN_04888 [Planoprotostelium fungivorum]|uniref:Intraflagellar transport protein 80 n=1 Tax=Planoprotostelium fungivorum TaxID=1890364 RepID=A0A2P6NF48_9EUKA|nr:hypothetical protein PROFUN_04888 [Planoprotostelium fungivorum]
MRLKVAQATVTRKIAPFFRCLTLLDKDIVTALGWTSTNELVSVGDDKVFQKWNSEGEALAQMCTLDTYVTDIHWAPIKKGANAETLVAACTDGSFRLIGKNGKIEKTVEKAHTGAVTASRWSYDATSLITAGEDGNLKVWSRLGVFRSTLLSVGSCIYSVAWGPNNDQILLAVGKELIIKPINPPTAKQMQWKAHDGTVLKVDWNPVNNMIISAGEDCKYKVWDAYGRLLYQSQASDSITTSVAWAPDGELFAVGSFNTIQLCDKTGWSYSRERTTSGSLFNLAWTTDGTGIAGAGGNGSVVFGHIIDRRIEWQNFVASLDQNNHVIVQDCNTDTLEELSFRDRVIKLSLGFDYLVVATSTQCSIYNIQTWSSPVAFDLKDTVNLIIQSQKHFLTVDNINGINLYNYEGRFLSNPKFALRTEFSNEQTMSLSNDYLAILERSDRKSIHILDLATGKATEPIRHSCEINEIFMNQYGGAPHRKVGFIDKNHDLYIAQVLKAAPVKLASMVNSAMWNDKTDMLAAIVDGAFVVWLYPNCVFFDKDLTYTTRTQKENTLDFGKDPHITSFFGKTCTVRRTDGASLTTSVTIYPLMLYEYCEKGDYEKAVRLCRFVKNHVLWATLAAAAVDGNDLNTAEVAFAAVEEVDKLQFITHIKQIPSLEGRSAEMYIYKGQIREAETILLQAGLVFRAIKLNIRLYKALELAVRYKVHVDTVLAYRNRYLTSWNKTEDLPEFIKQSNNFPTIEWEEIKAKMKAEKDREGNR